MDHDVLISDILPGQELEGFYVLSAAQSKTTASGKPFLSGTLSDMSGTVELKVWDYRGPLSSADAGKVVKLRGQVSEYKGSLQISASRIRLASSSDSYSLSSLVPTAPIDMQAAYDMVCSTAQSLEDADYRAVCLAMLERHGEDFRRIPAAKSVHHGFLGGLLMHTANMLQIADFLSSLYAEVIDRSLLLSGVMLHDFAKIREFTFSNLGLATGYSVEGQLIGHLVMGAQELASLCTELGIPDSKSILLRHMILSHHGQPEFGAAVVPMCAEAELLSYIDLIDSRMEIYAETLENLPAGSFSNRVFSLDNKKLYKHE